MGRLGATRITLQCDATDRALTHSRFEAANELLVGEQLVNVGAVRRRAHDVRETREATMEMRQERFGIESVEPECPAEPGLECATCRREVLQDSMPPDGAVVTSLYEETAQ